MSNERPDLDESVAERFRKLGNEQFKAGKYEEAVGLYTKSLNKVKSWEAFSNRAAAYLKLSRFDDALDDSAHVVTIDDKNFKGHFRMAQSLFGMKQSVAAVLQCERCLKLWPEHPDVIQLLKDVKEYEKSINSSQFQTLSVRPNSIELTSVDFEIIRFNSWKQLTEKLRSCHTPIKKVDIDEYFDADAMECFRLVDPICFSEYINFECVDFYKVDGSFQELFNGLLKAKDIALCGVEGVDNATFSYALINFSCFRNALFVDLCDPLQRRGKSLVIEIGAIFSFLHSYCCESPRLIIDYNSLTVEVEVLWDILIEKFGRDGEKFSYLLQIRCPEELVKPKERYVRNLRNSEMLLLLTEQPNLFAGELAAFVNASGYVLGIRRRPLKYEESL